MLYFIFNSNVELAYKSSSKDIDGTYKDIFISLQYDSFLLNDMSTKFQN